MLKSSTLIALLVCTTLLHAGCGRNQPTPAPGDRPPDGGCPESNCDALARLFFSGAALGDQITAAVRAPYAILKGGTQNIHVWLDDGARRPFDMLPPHDGLPGPNCVDSMMNPPAFCAFGGDRSVLAVEPVSPPVVTVKGLREGQDVLRITTTYGVAKDVLYDRINLDVVSLGSMRVVAPDSKFALLHGNLPIAFAVNSMPSLVVVGMFAADNVQRVVDESLRFSISDGDPLSIHPHQWDSLMVTTAFDKIQDHTIQVKTGDNLQHEVTFKVVGTVNDLEITAETAHPTMSIRIASRVCFSSFARDDMGANLLIYGAKLSFDPVSNVTVLPVPASEEPQVRDSCVNVQPTAQGMAATIRVTSDANPNIVGGERQELFSWDVP